MKRVYDRGNATIETPFLVSCALFLLDRRFWVLGIRHPLQGIRFDLLARLPSVIENLLLVEVKYRGDGRPVRPYELRRFSQEVARIKAALSGCIVQGAFMTNTRFSENALSIARQEGIRTFHKVPLLFEVREGEKKKRKSTKRKNPDTAHKHLSSNVSNRAGG